MRTWTKKSTTATAVVALVAIGISSTVGAVTQPSPAHATEVNVLSNWDFELGDSGAWDWSAGTQPAVIDRYDGADRIPPHTGLYRALLGGPATGNTTWLSQDLTVPLGGNPTLDFWMYIETYEISTMFRWDKLTVQVTSPFITKELHTYSNLDATNDYVQHSLSLLEFKGQAITLRFIAKTDVSQATQFVLDEVSVTPHASSTIYCNSPGTVYTTGGWPSTLPPTGPTALLGQACIESDGKASRAIFIMKNPTSSIYTRNPTGSIGAALWTQSPVQIVVASAIWDGAVVNNWVDRSRREFQPGERMELDGAWVAGFTPNGSPSTTPAIAVGNHYQFEMRDGRALDHTSL